MATAAIATEADSSKADAAKALDAVVKTITNAVAGGDSMALVGFGTIKASAVR